MISLLSLYANINPYRVMFYAFMMLLLGYIGSIIYSVVTAPEPDPLKIYHKQVPVVFEQEVFTNLRSGDNTFHYLRVYVGEKWVFSVELPEGCTAPKRLEGPMVSVKIKVQRDLSLDFVVNEEQMPPIIMDYCYGKYE